jgi:hypothetical protein
MRDCETCMYNHDCHGGDLWGDPYYDCIHGLGIVDHWVTEDVLQVWYEERGGRP